MVAGRERRLKDETVARRSVDEERDVAEEVADRRRRGGVVVVADGVRRRRRGGGGGGGRLSRRRQDDVAGGRQAEGVPVERLVRVQLAAADERRRPQVGRGQREEQLAVGAVVQGRAQAGRQTGRGEQLRLELQLRRDIRARLVDRADRHAAAAAAAIERQSGQDGRGPAPRVLPRTGQVPGPAVRVRRQRHVRGRRVRPTVPAPSVPLRFGQRARKTSDRHESAQVFRQHV